MNADSLVARLTALERQNRALRNALSSLVLLALATVMMAQVAPGDGEVRGTRIVLVDAQGTTLATLGVLDGAPSLELRDGKGTPSGSAAPACGPPSSIATSTAACWT